MKIDKANTAAQVRRTQAMSAPLTPRAFDPDSPVPLYSQLYDALREAMLGARWIRI